MCPRINVGDPGFSLQANNEAINRESPRARARAFTQIRRITHADFSFQFLRTHPNREPVFISRGSSGSVTTPGERGKVCTVREGKGQTRFTTSP